MLFDHNHLCPVCRTIIAWALCPKQNGHLLPIASKIRCLLILPAKSAPGHKEAHTQTAERSVRMGEWGKRRRIVSIPGWEISKSFCAAVRSPCLGATRDSGSLSFRLSFFCRALSLFLRRSLHSHGPTQRKGLHFLSGFSLSLSCHCISTIALMERDALLP